MNEQKFMDDLDEILEDAVDKAETCAKYLWSIYESILETASERGIKRLPFIREEDENFVVSVYQGSNGKDQLMIQTGSAAITFYLGSGSIEELKTALIANPKESATALESVDKIRDMVIRGFKKAFNGE